MTSGVYKLSFGTLVYIGRSSNIEQRYRAHVSDIQLGKSSSKLCSAYVQYGLPKLEILHVEEDFAKQKELEVYYIRHFNSYVNGLNSTEGGEDILYGELNHACKYTNNQLMEVLRLLANNPEMLLKDISSISGVHMNTVREVSAGTKHLWLSLEYPDLYAKHIANKPNRKSRSLANLTDKFRFKSKLEVLPTLISPSGEEVNIDTSISEFARKHGLQVGNLSSVLNGSRKTHKGWKLKSTDGGVS